MSAISSIDFLIVGAGFSGLVTAERLTNSGFRCVVIDQRDHLGGNAYDVQPVSVSFDLVEADQPSGVISCDYAVRYRTKVADLSLSP